MILQVILNTQYLDLQHDYFDPTHYYQIRSLAMPLFCDTIGSLTRKMNLTHAGVGFVDLNDSTKQWVYQYDVSPINYTFNFIDWLRPLAHWNDNTNLWDFKFDLKVAVYVEDEIKTGDCGWEFQTIIASNVKGDILNMWGRDYAQWYADTYSWYTIFEMRYENYTKAGDIHANQCHDFVWWGMQSLQNTYGVKFNGKQANRLHGYVQLNHTFDAPRRLNLSTKVDNDYLYKWYSKYYTPEITNLSDIELAERFFSGSLYGKDKHVFEIVNPIDNSYFTMKTNIFPFIWYKTEQVIAPGTD
ncbi:Conserved_hypothetical protein [Hexamita inflata]|uniref:Uncharacterized protein n=1 Tax=Hexamita inflata TaxID=28002 RepID=A0AA86TM76_9EUKA|nr:Conserved hypothetical protein [Hexamita inflata]